MKKIIDFLNQPFPYNKSNFWENGLFAGIIVFLLLYVLKPFGIDHPSIPTFKACFIFGLITFVINYLLNLFYDRVLRIDRDLPTWTFWKWLLTTWIIVLCIFLGNYMYYLHLTHNSFSVLSLFQMFVVTTQVAIFPVLIAGLSKLTLATAKYQKIASDAPLPEYKHLEGTKSLMSQNGEVLMIVDLFSILYVQAMQNYVAVYYLKNENVKKQILRTTLKNIENQLGEPFVKCHRSYVVNKEHIDQISGNAQGLLLKLVAGENQIPVSRKFIPIFRNSDK